MRLSARALVRKIKESRKELSTGAQLLILLSLLTLVFAWEKGLFQILTHSSLAGRDLVGHLAFAHLFNQISGISGWSHLWFAGFPGLSFYPPCFFLLVNLISTVSLGLIPVNFSFRLVVFLSLLLFPILAYISLLKLKFRTWESFFASLFALYYVYVADIYSLSLQALNEGLVVQVFALGLFVVTLPYLWRIEGNKNALIGSILLGLIFLSHPFLAAVALLSLLYKLILKRKDWLSTLATLALALLIASPWLVNLRWLKLTEFYQLGTASPFNFSLIFLPLILLSLSQDKKRQWLVGLFLTLFLLGTVGLPFSSQVFPFQYKRFYHYSLAIGSLLAGLGLWKLYGMIKQQLPSDLMLSDKKRLVTGLILALLLGPLLFKAASSPPVSGWRSKRNSTSLYSAIENLGPGRMLVEVDGRNRTQAFVLQEMIPVKTGQPVLNELHVDSSLSSPYTLALQNQISPFFLDNPVCDLCYNSSVFSSHLFLKHLRRFNVKWILAKSERSKQDIGKKFELETEVGDYAIYEVPGKEDYYRTLQHKPILIIASLPDWEQFNQQIFTRKQLSDYTYVWARSEPENPDQFSAVYNLRQSDQSTVIQDLKQGPDLKTTGRIEIERFNVTKNRISLRTASNQTGSAPVLLKFSYFPRWRCDSCQVYLASPSLMLVQANKQGKTVLRYR